MAAGSSAPELFSSVVSMANPNATSEVGVGTIVGSAVFNVLCIIGVTAIFAGQTLQLDWKPVTRDALFYSASIVSIIVFFNDGIIMWYEGMIAVICYALYVLFMVFNAKIMDAVDSLTNKVQPAAADVSSIVSLMMVCMCEAFFWLCVFESVFMLLTRCCCSPIVPGCGDWPEGRC